MACTARAVARQRSDSRPGSSDARPSRAAPAGPSVRRVRSSPLSDRAFVRLCAATFAYFAAMGVGAPVLPGYVLGPAGGTNLELGLAIAVFSVSSLLLRPFVVPMARRWQPSRLVAVGALIVGVAEGLLALAPSSGGVVLLRALAGLGEAIFFVLVSSAVYDLVSPTHHGRAMSWFSAVLSAALLGSPVLGEFVRAHAGFAAVWLLVFALCAVAALLTWSLPLARQPPAVAPGLRIVHRAGLRPGLLLAFNTWGTAAFITFAALYVGHLGHGGAAPEFAAFGVMVLAVRVLGAGVIDRADPRAAALASLALQSVCMLLLALADSSAALIACSGLFGAAGAFGYPALMSMATRTVAPAERGEVVATMTACFDGGYAVAALVLAGAFALGGFSAVFLSAAVVLAAGAAVLARLLLSTPPPPAVQPLERSPS